MNVGLGYRDIYKDAFLNDEKESVSFIEFLFDNLLVSDSALDNAYDLSQRYPIALHAVSLNIAGIDPLDLNYLKQIKKTISRLKPFAFSDHLCFSHHRNAHHHDLLPISYTDESLKHCIERIDQIQSKLDFPIALENLSAYLKFENSDYAEFEFMMELVQKTGCKILVDFNNLIVNKHNHGIASFERELEALFSIPKEHFAYSHIAGFEVFDGAAIDTHGSTPSNDAIQLASQFIQQKTTPDFRVLLEWDQNIPEAERILQEVSRVKRGLGHEA